MYFSILFFSRGICKCCGSQLKRFSLPVERRENLQKKLFDIAETSISKVLDNASVSKLPDFNISSSFNPQNKINEFKHYLITHGPFDVVLDVLNIAYYRDRGFNSFQVWARKCTWICFAFFVLFMDLKNI